MSALILHVCVRCDVLAHVIEKAEALFTQLLSTNQMQLEEIRV